MSHPGPDTSSKWRSAAALFAFAAALGVWSSPVAFADDGDDAASSDGPSAEALRNARNPYVSGPLAEVGGPSAGGQQDIGQTIDDALGGVTQGGGDGIGQTVNGILDGVAQGGGGDGIGQAIDGVLNGVTQGGGGDGIGQAIGGVLGKVAQGGGKDGQVPDAVRKGVIRLNKALGDTGYNSDDDSHGAGNTSEDSAAPDDDN